MAAAIEGDVTITDGKKIDRDIEARKNVITRAYSEIGGIPKNHLKTNAFRVSPSAWRVNVYVEVPTECFIKSAKIEHSLYIKE